MKIGISRRGALTMSVLSVEIAYNVVTSRINNILTRERPLLGISFPQQMGFCFWNQCKTRTHVHLRRDGYNIGGRFNIGKGENAIQIRRFQSSKNQEVETDYSQLKVNNLPRLYVGTVSTEPVLVSSLDQLAKMVAGDDTIIKKVNNFYDGAIIPLTSDQAHYLTTVLRIIPSGASTARTRKSLPPFIRIFDEMQEEWLAELISINNSINDGRKRTGKINGSISDAAVICRSVIRSPSMKSSSDNQKKSVQLRSSCWLCVAPTKNKDRFRWMIEKTTELNCNGYIWLNTDFTEQTVQGKKKMNDPLVTVSFDKLQSYAIEASEQCERLSIPLFCTLQNEGHESTKSTTDNDVLESLKRNHIPSIADMGVVVEDLVADALRVVSKQENTYFLICRERSTTLPILNALEKLYDSNLKGLETATSESKSINIFFLIGPEGGWSEREEQILDEFETNSKEGSVINISLGPTILRAETAAITAATAQMLYADQTRYSRKRKDT